MFKHHVSKGANYKTQLSKLTKLIVICDDDNCAWRCRASYILASKQWEIRKLYEPYTCSNTSISHDHAKLSYLLISKSIHNLIKNDPSTSVSALIAHIKSTEGYTTTYRKAWLVKQKAIENIYDNWKYHTTIYQDFCKLCNNCFLAWSFKPCIDGFQYCKPVVQVDGTWLYNKYKGTLLVAVAQDSNNKSFQ
ncbi:hypothetical protein HKD37_04G010396 [Glycine soja]